MTITVTELTKRYGEHAAVDDLSLEIADGEFLVLLGPSGCGKTTTMRSIVGLETPDRGRISVAGKVVFDKGSGINVPVHRRNMGMVFQSYAIWPHKTVFENVAFPLRMKRLPAKTITSQVNAVLELVGLSGMADRGASLLSGGQMQRVAFARSVAHEPAVLLLDEPLSNLDAKLRDRMRVDLRAFQQRLGITAIYVTHDQAEALALGDRVAVMNAGRIEQLGTPDDVYYRPTSRFVADFLGSANLIPVSIVAQDTHGCAVMIDGGGARIRSDQPMSDSAASSGTLCIRPEEVVLKTADDQGGPFDEPNSLTGEVTAVGFQGQYTEYQVRIPQITEPLRSIEMKAPSYSVGAKVVVSFPASSVRVLTR